MDHAAAAEIGTTSCGVAFRVLKILADIVSETPAQQPYEILLLTIAGLTGISEKKA